ncbi:hypothetical protein IEO21_00240 [Rhodonia placenta]|uniref:RINT-1 family protein n=1 Tax=Rhodonia placenta TaxID=104341 RepID=A0A8H7PBM0_9APHY|nr:hypothetical protein IEO21_00240 [Postia placenta]
MASAQIQVLLEEPKQADSEKRTLEFLNARYRSLQDFADQAELAHPRPCSHSDVAAQLAQSRQALDVLVAQTREDAAAHLHTAQELSLLRHSLSDELAYLSEQLLSSLAVSDGKVTLLEDLEALHRNVKELESVKSYVQVIQHALKLSEYETLQRFVAAVRNACVKVEDVTGQQQLHILHFLEHIRDKTWQDIKAVLAATLLAAAEKLHWPTPVDYLAASPADRVAFESAFLNLLKMQTIGKKLHAGVKGKGVEKEGLYPIQALVQPVSLRFKYHFEGTRQTNRLDKPEWYFTHILNVSHEHRRFMEGVVQALLSGTEYKQMNAWREFTSLLLPLLERKLKRTVPSLLSHPPVLAHTIYESLAFDSALREDNFDINGTSAERDAADGESKPNGWEGISDVILGRKEWFETWLEGEREFAIDQYMNIISAPDAWLIANDYGADEDDVVSDPELKPTNSARRVKALVEQVTDRYSPLPQFAHRTRFLISVQLPILESYHARISSSLDAFETLSSSFMRAVPGALGAVTDSAGRSADPKHMTSGVEGVQRLVKALVSAKFIAAACEAWGEELFFLELWAEINRRASLRSRAQAAAALPDPKGGEDAPEGTIFEELVTQYGTLAERAEDMTVQSVCSEIEAGLRAHFSGSSSTRDDISLAASLLGPVALLSSQLTFLQSSLPRAMVTTLYRRMATRLSAHILSRQFQYRGRGRLSPQDGKAILAETELWVETCQVALAGSERPRVEAPWRRLLQASRLVGADGNKWQRVVDSTFGATEDSDWEAVMLDTVGCAELDRDEVGQILRTRWDCDR